MADRVFWDDQFRENPANVMVRNPFLPEVISDLEPGLALDLGCGTGENSLTLIEQGWQVTGVDWSSYAVELARQRINGGTFICADIRTWQSAQAFDLVILSFAIPKKKHDAGRVVRNAIDLLRVGGQLLVCEWDKSMEAIWNQGVAEENRISNLLLSVNEVKGLVSGLVIEQEVVHPVPSENVFPAPDDPRRQYQSHMNTILIQASKPA